MSRSRKKHAITGFTTAKSEKDDKRFARQKERQRVKSLLKKVLDSKSIIDASDALVLPKKQEIRDIWSMAKDGKQRIEKSSKWYKKAVRK